jgi:hypothetical protein
MGKAVITSPAKRGTTLIEAVLYVATALSLIVGGIFFFLTASEEQKTSQLVHLTSAVVAEGKAIAAMEGPPRPMGAVEYDPGYGRLLAASGAIPAQYVLNQSRWVDGMNFETSIATPWRTGMEMWMLPYATIRYRLIWVFVSDIPVSACVKLVRSDVPNNQVNESGLHGNTIANATSAVSNQMVGACVAGHDQYPFSAVLRNYSTNQVTQVCCYGSEAYGRTIGNYTGDAPRLERVNLFLLYMF